MLPRGASKGDGLRRLLGELGVDPANVLACGDGENDVEMLQLVGTSCAMGNAAPKVRVRSTYPCTPTATPCVAPNPWSVSLLDAASDPYGGKSPVA